MKKCFKCGELKPLPEFYKHKQMKDGHLNKCKSCNKKDVIKNRMDNIDYYREYDRKRGNRQNKEYLEKYRKEYPKKYKAVSQVNKAIRLGMLFNEPCEVCKDFNNVHAHHDDYAKPLNIRWLCPAHHSQWHKENGPGLNGD